MKLLALNFDEDKLTFLLSVDPKDIDFSLIQPAAKEKGFFRKSEFHITVILFSVARQIKEIIEASPDKENITKKIKKLAEEIDWSFELQDEYYQLKREYIFNDKFKPGEKIKETRETIIQFVSLSGLKVFYEKLNKILSSNFETPPAHITLFVKGYKGRESEGIGFTSLAEFKKINPVKLSIDKNSNTNSFHTLILPTRPQPDTLIAIFFLKNFGQNDFPGIEKAEIKLWQVLPDGKSPEILRKEGFFLLDIGAGKFDHHNLTPQTTVADLAADYLEIKDDPAIAKLLEYARRDDFYGKGTISTDSLDRAFGLSGLITALNKNFQDNPSKIAEIILPILESHYQEECRRTKEMPIEIDKKIKEGKVTTIKVRQRKNNLKVIYIESENPSLPGYLRSQQGGRHDIVAQRLPSGHVNFLTRPTKRVDLRNLVSLIRNAELMLKGKNYDSNLRRLSQVGRLEETPEWYFDDATNSLFNGGINPEGVNPTKISTASLLEIIKLAFS